MKPEEWKGQDYLPGLPPQTGPQSKSPDRLCREGSPDWPSQTGGVWDGNGVVGQGALHHLPWASNNHWF